MTDPALSRLQTLPSWMLGRAAALGHRLVADQLARAELRLPHHAVLCAVAEYEPVAQAELARTVKIDPKDMVAVLNDLQARELVSRTRDPKDARRNLITLSPAGRELLHHTEALGAEANAELVAPLTPAERRQLNDLLGRIIAER
ncbi:MarR family winged helix-turn-helix transcriptional regulator [Kitasatospora sp. GP82]|uniref:MarR family winged helix-turn-helix transcriptional regulator n=1 Tax=Kitasatospora sp. GP82 TaxID=3035089 RepID=UPI002475DDDB|nr:MarR family winged helix-turn-helix transcriptional regulator [Kitasatospora sp. GP82]MDH6130160.1 DNA-binding MarR family transcriptional regulator [Kitasatospora sp. GP82]